MPQQELAEIDAVDLALEVPDEVARGAASANRLPSSHKYGFR